MNSDRFYQSLMSFILRGGKKRHLFVLVTMCCLFILCSQSTHLRVMAQTVGITGDNTINQCETKTYTAGIQNNSGNPLTDLVVTARLDSLTGFSYVAGTATIDVGGTPICSGAGDNDEPVVSGTDLIWNINTQCPNDSPLTLANGQTLNVTFDLTTNCTAVSGALDARFDYEISGTPMFETEAHSIQVLPGAVTIKKTPNVILQEVGQDVTWTLTIENTGLGVVKNVAVTDVLEAGLRYVSSSPVGSNAGQTTTWGTAEIPGFASLAPGETITIVITATVISCQNLENSADVRWGCDLVTDCYHTADTLPPLTARASVGCISSLPFLDYTPPDVSFTYCGDYVDVAFPISNIGGGTAHDVWILADFDSLTVSDVSAGATYNSIDKRFELADPLPPSGSYALSFRLNYFSWCGGSFPAGDLLWQSVYKDDSDNEFYIPAKHCTIQPPSNSTSLSVTKVGGGQAIQIGDQVTYNIVSFYSGPLNCGSGGSVNEITVMDTVPDGFTVVDAGGGTWIPSGSGTGGTVTWTYTPPASLNTSITLQSPSPADCETYCFTTFTNSVSATGTDCCGCSVDASASQTTAIECEELVDSNKTANPITQERGRAVQYTNTYDFGNAGVLFNTLIFTEYAENQQQYVPGSLTVTYNGADITGCVLVNDTTPGGNLFLDFSGCAADMVNNKNLTIVYRLTVTEATVAACDGITFYSWSGLQMGSIGSGCLQDGEILETTVVTVQPPAMSLSVTGLDEIVSKGDTRSITINLAQTSGVANPRDVRLVLSGLNYYVVDPGATVCSGVAPTSCTPALVGGDYVWYFADGFSGSGQNATLQLNVQKRCSGSGDLAATAYYDDNYNDDAVYNDTCSTIAVAPPILLSGDLLIEKTPAVYYATTNTVGWKIYLTNRGAGAAYNVWVDDVLGAGLDYVSAVVDDMTGVTITADQDHNGGPINGATISIAQMAAGKRLEITLTAHLVGCSSLANDVSASWGCVGMDCQVAVTDHSTVEIPPPSLINNNVVTTPAEPCSAPEGLITLKNAGQTAVYNLQVTETLPAGLLYVSGSTRWRVNGGAWNGPNAAYDPSPTTSPLRWTSAQIPGLAVVNPGDTIEIEYDLNANCPFAGGNVTVSTRYENPCGQVSTAADGVFTVAFREPNITVTQTRADEPIGCGELVEWTITVQNNSGYALPLIWVEDTLDAAFTYDSSVGDPPYTSDNGTFDGVNTVSWELRNVNHNDTVVLTLRATTDSTPCSPNLDNTVRAWWGCGAADGSSATKPGDDPPDNTLCLANSSVDVVRTETREPTMSFADIALTPTFIDSCNSSTEVSVAIQNTGTTDASDVDLVITLPAGLSYIAGSSEVCVGTDETCATTAVGDPTIVGNQLGYYNIADQVSNLADLVQANSGNDTVKLTFSVRSNCYATADVGFRLYYYDCCGNTQHSITTSETLTSLYPALSITKTPANSQIACGSLQTWSIGVTNNGDGNAQVVRIEDTPGSWITVDPGASTAGLTDMGGGVWGWEVNNLAAGSSHIFTLVGTLNSAGNDCTTSLRQNNVRAIWGCGTAGDATDNDPTTTAYDCTYATWANAPATTLQMPDLVVTAITPAISATADGVFSGAISVTVRNQGDGVASGGFQVSVDDGNGWIGTGSYSGDLAAGAETTVVIDASSWNPDCTSCTNNFTASVDSGDTVCECQEGNNTFGPQAYSPNTPDLVVESNTLAISCAADGQCRVSGTVTLRNAGCSGTLTEDVPMRLTLVSGTGCGGAQVAQWTQTFTEVNIPVGGTQAFAITDYDIVANACTSASGCQFSMRIEADYSATISECDGTNNTLCSDKTFSIPDLHVDSDTLAISCNVDGGCRIQGDLTIANDGCGSNFVTGIPISIRLYNNNAICSGPNSSLIFTQAGVNIPAGGTQTFAINRTLARNLCTNSTGCQVALGVELDYSNAICECTNANNAYCSPNKTVSIPDLQVTGDTLSVNCLQDGQVRVSGDVTIANTGCNAPVAGNLPVRFTLFSNTGCGGAQVAQWTETFAGANIATGSSQVFNITDRDLIANICTSSTGGQVSLRIEADPSPSTVCECSGGNNTRCSNKTVSAPDLRITAVTPSIACIADGNLSSAVQVTVNNDGLGAVNNVPVRLTSDCGHTFTDQTIASLASGASTTLAFSFTPDISAGTCTFTAATDPDNVICECDGTNNALASAPFTPTVPDIQVQANTLMATCSGDGQCAVAGTVTLVNAGYGANLTADVPMRFTLLDNTGCGGNQLSQWTQTFTGVNLASGGGAQVFTVAPQTIATDLCTNSTNCQVSIRVEADYNGSICEYDGTNNTYCADNKSVDIPNLEVQSDTLSVSGTGDGQGSISGTVTLVNNGCGANLTSDIPMRFILFDNTGGSGNQLAQWTESFTGVNIVSGGGTQVFTVTPQTIVADLCANSTNCQVSIRVEPDYDHSICECDGTDQPYLTDKSVSIPDLTVNSVTPSVISGTVTVGVSNIGCATASGAVVRLTSDCGISFMDQTVDLAASNSRDIVFNFTPPASPYGCRLTAIIDPDSALDECSGTNNTAAGAYSGLSIFKSVAPTTNVAYHGIVTYTVVLTNTGTVSDTNVLLTDTLPAAVEFGSWLEQPAGTVRAGNAITWTGTLTNNTAITFTFTATHIGDYGDVVTNTAHFTGMTPSGSDDAVFAVRVNGPPIADAGLDQTVNAAAGVRLDGSASNDPEGHLPLAYRWTQTGGPPVSLSSATAVSPTFTAPITPTVLTFTLAVTDSFGLADPTPDTVVITVSNRAPIANAGLDQTVNAAASVRLDGSASSDPDGHLPLAYRWTQTGGPPVSLSSATAVSPTFTAPITPTVLTFTLVVTDSFGLADPTPDTVVITVSNRAPIADAGLDQTVNAAAGVRLDGSASSDPDGHLPLAYRWTQTGGPPVSLSSATAASPIFTAPTTSTVLTFTLVVTDSFGLADPTPDTVVITVARRIYLPLVCKGFVSAPDLTVKRIIAAPDAITVVIENQGSVPVLDEFWVDLYINPSTAPTRVNQTWSMLGSQGAAWGITAAALPSLQPGGVLTLTTRGSDPYYWPSLSHVVWPLAAGTPVYAQVDSANLVTTYGAVLEDHEITGRPYNNITGPVVSIAVGGTAQTPTAARPPILDSDLPRRH